MQRGKYANNQRDRHRIASDVTGNADGTTTAVGEMAVGVHGRGGFKT